MKNTVFPGSQSIAVDSKPQPEALRAAILNQARVGKKTIAITQSATTTGTNNGKINGEQCEVDDDSS